MSTNVEPEETQAIMDLMGTQPERSTDVVERDFRRPRRLSAQVRVELARLFKEIVPRLEDRLEESLGSRHPLELGDVGEASAEEVAAESDLPLLALRFQVNGQPAWIVWENLAAVTAVEKILGSKAESSERRLSHVECRVVQDVLAPIAQGFAEGLGFQAQDFAIAQSLENLGDWREGGEGADSHRLEIELGFRGPGEASTLRVYLPCPELMPLGEGSMDEIQLPAHLGCVDVSLSAQLSGCEVSLDQLLALEEGDVIPIDARLDDLAVVTVEGCAFARARLGQSAGRLAIRIEQLEDNPEENR